MDSIKQSRNLAKQTNDAIFMDIIYHIFKMCTF